MDATNSHNQKSFASHKNEFFLEDCFFNAEKIPLDTFQNKLPGKEPFSLFGFYQYQNDQTPLVCWSSTKWPSEQVKLDYVSIMSLYEYLEFRNDDSPENRSGADRRLVNLMPELIDGYFGRCMPPFSVQRVPL